MSGTWRGATLLAGAIILGALAQAATAIPGYSGTDSIAFRLATVGSLLVLVLQTILIAWAATAIARNSPLGRLPWALAAWAVLLDAIVVVVATLLPVALPLAWALALVVLPSAATGRWRPLAAFSPFRRHPWRASAALVVMLLTGVLGVVVGLTTGLFLTGILGGLVLWLWVGVLGALLMLWWARLLLRPGA